MNVYPPFPVASWSQTPNNGDERILRRVGKSSRKVPILICCVGKCQNRKQIMVPYMVSKQFRQSPRVVSAGGGFLSWPLPCLCFVFVLQASRYESIWTQVHPTLNATKTSALGRNVRNEDIRASFSGPVIALEGCRSHMALNFGEKMAR